MNARQREDIFWRRVLIATGIFMIISFIMVIMVIITSM